MLTDRQLVAMTFLANTISNEADLVFLARSPGNTIDYALTCADKFLEKTKSSHLNSINLETLQEQNLVLGERIERIIEINQELTTNNRALIELINNNIRQETV
ncbi:MAG: hypothetical protein ACRC2M_07810 [Planktothrix sp.]